MPRTYDSSCDRQLCGWLTSLNTLVVDDTLIPMNHDRSMLNVISDTLLPLADQFYMYCVFSSPDLV